MRTRWAIPVFAVFLVAASAEAARVNVTLRLDPDQLAGADADGRVLLFTPSPFDPGSTGAHYDNSPSPDLLMEPGLSGRLPVGEVDITTATMRDLGWRGGGLSANITYADAAGGGFNDAQLGAARKAAFEFAVARWEQLLGSSVAVDIEARFRNFMCDETGGTLASAGPSFAFIDTPGADPGVWHTGALAESLAGQNLSGANSGADLEIFFNRQIDEGCLGEGTSFYYGLEDGAGPGEISFVNVALHELAHGLGFSPLADPEDGSLFNGGTDVFTRLIFDNQVDKFWDEMSDGERRRSARRPGQVVLAGERTGAAAAGFLDGTGFLRVNRPRNLAGLYEIGAAVFGPPLDEKGVRGNLALVDDGSANPTFGCEPLVNGREVAGKVALIDRGDCFFTEKVKNAQNAGAIAVVIVHDEAGPPPLLGGSDSTIAIPSVRVGRKDGRRLKRKVRR